MVSTATLRRSPHTAVQFSLQSTLLVVAAAAVVAALSTSLEAALVAILFLATGVLIMLGRHELPLWIIVALYVSAATALDVLFGVLLFPSSVATAAGFGLLLTGPTLASGRQRRVLALTLTMIAWLFLLQALDSNPTKPFRRAFSRIEPGMAMANVLAVFRDEFDGQVPYHREHDGHLTFVLDRNDGRYNSEEITLEMPARRVAKKSYWPD